MTTNTITLPYRLGHYYPEQGGAFAGIGKGESGQPDGLLFFAVETRMFAKPLAFGSFGNRVEGADSDFDGLANTTALINSGIEHPAAQSARAHTYNGLSDFYLPSREELRIARATIPDLFKKGNGYWTSTQDKDNSHYAWCQNFYAGGSQWYDVKLTKLLVCPVRRLLIIQ